MALKKNSTFFLSNLNFPAENRFNISCSLASYLSRFSSCSASAHSHSICRISMEVAPQLKSLNRLANNVAKFGEICPFWGNFGCKWRNFLASREISHLWNFRQIISKEFFLKFLCVYLTSCKWVIQLIKSLWIQVWMGFSAIYCFRKIFGQISKFLHSEFITETSSRNSRRDGFGYDAIISYGIRYEPLFFG